MIINVAPLTLRFYRSHGWNKLAICELLVDPTIKIIYRRDKSSKAKKELLGDLSYYAVYEDSGHKVFKKSEMEKHTFFSDKQRFQGIEWYIDSEK